MLWTNPSSDAVSRDLMMFCIARDHAGTTQLEVETELRSKGWMVFREVPQDYRRLGFMRHGRIDLVAERGQHVVAIELDNRTPRRSSVAKLLAYKRATARMILLRHPRKDGHKRRLNAGIDSVLYLRSIKEEQP